MLESIFYKMRMKPQFEYLTQENNEIKVEYNKVIRISKYDKNESVNCF